MADSKKVQEKLKSYRPSVGDVQWNHWARTMTMASSHLLYLGGIPALFYGIIYFFVGVFAIILGAVLLTFTLPLEILQKKGVIVIFQHFMIVGPVLLLTSIPFAFCLPTLLGSITLFFAGFLYIVASIRKEKGLTKKEIMEGKLI